MTVERKKLQNGDENSFGAFLSTISNARSADYSLQVIIPKTVDFYSQLKSADYPFRWLIFYREVSELHAYPFEMLEVPPWQAKPRLENYSYYLDLFSAGMEPKIRDGKSTEYQMVILICDQTDQVVYWGQDMACWSETVAAMPPARTDPFYASWLTVSGNHNEAMDDISTNVSVLDSEGKNRRSPLFGYYAEENGVMRGELSFRYVIGFSEDKKASIENVYIKESGTKEPYTYFSGFYRPQEIVYPVYSLYSTSENLSIFHLKEDGSVNKYDMVVTFSNGKWFKKTIVWSENSETIKANLIKNNNSAS